MSDQRINAGHLLAAVGAALLLVSPFIDWYGGGGREQLSGWSSFEAVDVIVAVTALLTLWVALPVDRIAGRGRQLPALDAAALPLAGLALLLVLANVLGRPPIARGADLEIGAWLGLAGALAVLAGLLLAESRLSVVIRISPRDEPGSPRVAVDQAPTTALDTSEEQPTTEATRQAPLDRSAEG